MTLLSPHHNDPFFLMPRESPFPHVAEFTHAVPAMGRAVGSTAATPPRGPRAPPGMRVDAPSADGRPPGTFAIPSVFIAKSQSPWNYGWMMV